MKKFYSSIHNCIYVIAIFFSLLLLQNSTAQAQGTWTKVKAAAPDKNFGGLMLLSDGTAICKSKGGGGSYGKTYNRLTPDSTGSYVNGTWSSLASMKSDRLYFSSQILMDGRLYVAGGEYGSGNSKGEVYDPLTNIWTAVPNPGGAISDANSEILPDGKVLQAMVNGNLKVNKIYDPATNSYSNLPDCIGIHNESTWIKLPDSSILQVDRGTTNSERFIPSLNKWIADGIVPVTLYDGILETGPGILLPDGRVWHEGATGHTAYYTPSGDTLPGTWLAGPDLPNGGGTDDAPLALMPDGKILIAIAPHGGFTTPTTFWEFDYLTNTYTTLNCPDGKPNYKIPCYETGMVLLPTGEVLVSFQDSANYYVYTPAGKAIDAGKPTIAGIYENGCSNSFTLTGTLFNGISEGACYGDDWQMATNFPIVRLTSTDNKVYYGRTYNWNRTDVMTGSLPDTCQLTLPANLPEGTYSLVVIANGFPSDPILFSPLAASITSIGDTMFCEGGTINFSANEGEGFTYQWMKDGTPIPYETATSYTANESGTYSVVVTNLWGCDSISNAIHVTVNPNPVAVITSSGYPIFCSGDSVTLATDSISGLSYQWMKDGNVLYGEMNYDYIATENGSYNLSVTDSLGCHSVSNNIDVIVNPYPKAWVAYNDSASYCEGDTVVLNANTGYGLGYQWMQDGNIIYGATGIIYYATSSGNYTVAVDSNTCTSISSEAFVIINPLPQVSVSSNDTSICKGSFAYLYALGADTYLWQPGYETGNELEVMPLSTTTYTVNGTDSNQCSNTSSLTIIVNELPIIFLGNDTTVCDTANFTLDAGVGFSSYEWSTGSSAQTIVTTTSGIYAVTITDANGCSNTDSILITVENCTGIHEIANGSLQIILQPNPAKELITIEFNAAVSTEYTIQLTDVAGRILFTNHSLAAEGVNQFEYNISSLAVGSYFVIITDGERSKVLKVIKQ